MKKPYLIVGSLACTIWLAQAQQEETIRVSQSDISLVYNQYLQTGDNSAVTGGIGTERLTIYGPAFSISHYLTFHCYYYNTMLKLCFS